jgi:hypothetical protein
MASLSTDQMRLYLSKSIASLNPNKLNGLLAEVDFRNYLRQIGFADHVSIGGWIVRSEGQGAFGHNTIVIFAETIMPGNDYGQNRQLPRPDDGLHTICATYHQIGIHSYYCCPVIEINDDPDSIVWYAKQLGVPTEQNYQEFPGDLRGFNKRTKRYKFLRNHTNVNGIALASIPEEFTKEHLRINLQSRYMSEISDIDGIFWGEIKTYPIEIKEKTVAHDNRVGDYFGLDAGPFVKLAFYAAKQGNFNSLFVVREIDDMTTRNLNNWWFITFNQMAQFASWTPISGGKSMTGGRSSVIKIPRSEFQLLNRDNLNNL